MTFFCAARGALASAVCWSNSGIHTSEIEPLYFSFRDLAFPPRRKNASKDDCADQLNAVVEAAVVVHEAFVRTPVDDAVYVVILHGFVQDQQAALFGVEALDAKDIVHHDGETTLPERRSQTNSHIHTLTDTLLDDTPDIDSDKNFLLVHPKEVLHRRRRRTASSSRCIWATRHKIRRCSGVSSLVYCEKVDYAKLFTKPIRAPSRRDVPTLLPRGPNAPFPLNEKHHLRFQNHNNTTVEGMEARSHFGFILLFDDAVFEDRDFNILMCEIDRHYNSTSDNIDTQRLSIKVTLRVVSAVYPRDRAVSQLLTTSRTPMDSWRTSHSP